MYLPLPTGVRKEWVIRAADAGKHVLVEKPVGVTADDVREMLGCLRAQPRAAHGRRDVHAQPAAGRMRRRSTTARAWGASAASSRSSASTPPRASGKRTSAPTAVRAPWLPGGPRLVRTRFALWVTKFELPTQVIARLLAEAGRPGREDKVPFEMSAELLFPGGVSAALPLVRTANQQWASVSGTKGQVHVPTSCVPSSATKCGSR